jgi:gluconate kinase
VISNLSNILVMNHSAIAVVFGRPGAGKSTVAEKAVALNAGGDSGIVRSVKCLDLDVCVPQWMKDNFAKGLYPTLEQRKEFAIGACDYVDEQLASINAEDGTIISFSFVNDDLRDVFRGRFPQAKWILIDTSEIDAQDRINKREGHFYKGNPNKTTDSKTAIKKAEEKESPSKPNADNNEWDFAPVTFDHIILDGLKPVEENAKRVIQVFNSK